MQCTKVDLPHPEGPAINTFSPFLIEKLISKRVGDDCASYLKPKSLNSKILLKENYSFKMRREVPRRHDLILIFFF